MTSHCQDKRNAEKTWKKGYGFHPMNVSADFGPGLGGEDLLIRPRPSDAGVGTAADHITAARRAPTVLPGADKGGRWTRRILFRTDTGGKAKGFINYLHTHNVGYSVGFAVNQTMGSPASTLPESVRRAVILSDNDRKAAVQRTDNIAAGKINPHEFVADLDKSYLADITGLITLKDHHIKLADYPDDMRVIVRVEYPAAGCNLRVTDVDGRRATAFATNQHGDIATSDLRHRARGRCEQQIRDTEDTGLSKMPHQSFDANRIWCATVVLGDVPVPLVGDARCRPRSSAGSEGGSFAMAPGDPHPRANPLTALRSRCPGRRRSTGGGCGSRRRGGRGSVALRRWSPGMPGH